MAKPKRQTVLTTEEVRALAADRMTEKQLLAAVRQLAKLHGYLCYHTHDSRRSEPGFVDLVLAKNVGDYRPPKIFFAELKTAKGRLTAAQKEWIDALGLLALWCPIVKVCVWRPADLPEIERLLR